MCGGGMWSGQTALYDLVAGVRRVVRRVGAFCVLVFAKDKSATKL